MKEDGWKCEKALYSSWSSSIIYFSLKKYNYLRPWLLPGSLLVLPCAQCILAVLAWLWIPAELGNGKNWAVCIRQLGKIRIHISLPDLQSTAWTEVDAGDWFGSKSDSLLAGFLSGTKESWWNVSFWLIVSRRGRIDDIRRYFRILECLVKRSGVQLVFFILPVREKNEKRNWKSQQIHT